MIFRHLFLSLLLISTPLAADPVDFELPGLDGKPLKLSDHRGKWVVVNFWASWCSPCVEELPALAAFQQAHADKAQLLGVNYEESTAAEAQAFLNSLGTSNFPHVKYDGSDPGLPASFFVDRDGKMHTLTGLPATFFVAPDGQLAGMHLGPLTQAELLERLAALGFPSAASPASSQQ